MYKNNQTIPMKHLRICCIITLVRDVLKSTGNADNKRNTDRIKQGMTYQLLISRALLAKSIPG